MRHLLAPLVALVAACQDGHPAVLDAEAVDAPACAGASLAGTWISIDNRGVMDPSSMFELLPDCTVTGNARFVAGGLVRSWSQPNQRELVFKPDGEAHVLGGIALVWAPVPPTTLSGPLAPPYNAAGATWSGSFEGCCANGSPYTVVWTLALNADGTATYDAGTTAMGPPQSHYDGTWTQEPFGFDLAWTTSGPDLPTSPYWLGREIGIAFQRQ